ncbi:mitochondrial distribution and morphology family 33, partial [Thelephora terrestris]
LQGYITKATGDTAIGIRKRADEFTVVSQALFSELGGQLNRATGYGEIELLKKKVEVQESRINAAREAAQTTKRVYEEAVIRRSNSQREVNELLQRKHTWTDADVGRFTLLVREDHSYEQAEARAKEAAKAADEDVERELKELLRSILARYHEEQIWSDKIRSASTYGSMAALALNLLVFIMATLIVEPWKRRRLAHTFEKKVEELSGETKDLLEKEIHDLATRL